MVKINEKMTKTEQKKGHTKKDAADQLATYIARNQLWASREETEEWLKTEEGQRIAALIEREREERRK